MPDIRLVVSCEHASNRIPATYRSLFPDPKVLSTHRALDIGALQLARQMSVFFDAPLFTATTSRLLIDLNRSLHHPKVFSEFSKLLDENERTSLINKYYRPYRDQVSRKIDALLEQKFRVVHISVHSFTPELNGESRNADIGLLYDPKRAPESEFCKAWKDVFHALSADTAVRRNYPYTGVQDGLITTLRKDRDPANYLGIELETNQRLPLTGGKTWEHAREVILHSLKTTLETL